MGTYSRVIGRTIRLMDMGFICTPMGLGMMGFGKMICRMGRELKFGTCVFVIC
jgi:hypothetical protein